MATLQEQVNLLVELGYKRLEAQDDWSAKPKHSVHSHLMDALRYAVMAIKEIQYLGLDYDGSARIPDTYEGFEEVKERASIWKKPEREIDDVRYY